MKTTELTYLLNNPQYIKEPETIALEAILLEFPFFQSVRALHLKGLHNSNSFRYNYELKKTASYTTDRSILFDFITSNDFTTVEKNNAQIEKVEEKVEEIEIKTEEKIETLVQITEEKTKEEVEVEEIIINKTEDIIEVEIEKSIQEAEVSETKTIEIESSFKDVEFINKENIEKELEIGLPIQFNQKEKHSFQEWLNLTQLIPINREQTVEKIVFDEEKQKKLEIIDKFIEANPKISPVKENTKTPVNININNDEPTHLMTETLAKVYLEQKKYNKAIQAYDILILKYPEKSSFFADRIKNIKELQQNN